MKSPGATLVVVSALLLSTRAVAAPEAPGDPAIAAGSIVDEIRSSASTVRAQLQAARAQRDVVKTLCLNDKVSQLDVTFRSASQQREALLATAAEGDAAVAQAQARLGAHREQARRVAAEAQQCAGSPEPAGDPGGHTFMTEPELPAAGDYPAPEDVSTVAQPPLAVSGFK